MTLDLFSNPKVYSGISDTIYQSCSRRIGCLSPRNLDYINDLEIGDSLVFHKGKLTFNQIKSRVHTLTNKYGENKWVIRNGETTINVWRWK